MSDKKKFPPRRAYSLQEAAKELGCSVEALIDWAHQGVIKICLKVTSDTRMSIPEWSKQRYARYIQKYEGQYGVCPDISRCNATVSVETSNFQWSDNYIGQTYIALHNDWIDTIADQTRKKIKRVFEEEVDGVTKTETVEDFEFDLDKKVSVTNIPGVVRGFWMMQSGRFYDFKLDRDNELEETLRSYGGDAYAISCITISIDELFLMKEEFDLLHEYQGESSPLNPSETINDFGVNKPWKEQLKPIADGYYEDDKNITATKLAEKLVTDARARNIRNSDKRIPAEGTIRKEFAPQYLKEKKLETGNK